MEVPAWAIYHTEAKVVIGAAGNAVGEGGGLACMPRGIHAGELGCKLQPIRPGTARARNLTATHSQEDLE